MDTNIMDSFSGHRFVVYAPVVYVETCLSVSPLHSSIVSKPPTVFQQSAASCIPSPNVDQLSLGDDPNLGR